MPVTLVDIRLKAGAEFEQVLPSSYNGFVVVIAGEIEAGNGATALTTDRVGWTNPLATDDESAMSLKAGENGARVLLYAGQPQNIHVVAQGPFIAGSKEELAGYYAAYRQGKFPKAGTVRPV